ncbi:hypothetical protein ACOMHN_009179 [Nucella lapillus]
MKSCRRLTTLHQNCINTRHNKPGPVAFYTQQAIGQLHNGPQRTDKIFPTIRILFSLSPKEQQPEAISSVEEQLQV